MQYEILYIETPSRPYHVIQRDAYKGWEYYTVHSRYEDRDTAQLVKEALEARQARN